MKSLVIVRDNATFHSDEMSHNRFENENEHELEAQSDFNPVRSGISTSKSEVNPGFDVRDREQTQDFKEGFFEN